MHSPVVLRVVLTTALVAACLWAMGTPVDGQSLPGPFKIAYYNIKGGAGQVGLPGAPTLFANSSNCTENAWGVGVVQAELRERLAKDPSVIVLGLSEAWACATPAAVQQVLGWAARTGERNGVAAIARYGFAGPEEWLQLDTSLTRNPVDTKWVVRAPVCLDAACSRSIVVFVAHATPATFREVDGYTVGDMQARQTLDFMGRLPAAAPHVLIGDLNVFEGQSNVCTQWPINSPILMYRQAGYLDAWPAVHGSAEGFTGMWNRARCGSPEGYLWKRIDYAWSKNLAPLSMQRFGMVPAGTAAPSDHAGLIVEYPHPDALAGTKPPTVAIRTPSAGATLAGTVSIEVDAADDLGVRRVELVVDGRPVAVDRTAPYAFSWDTTLRSNGPSVIQAAATDVTGHRVLSAPRTVTVKNSPGARDEIVRHAIEATAVHGNWTLVEDKSAASGMRLQNAHRAAPTVTAALSNPSSYVEFTFTATAGRPYRLWIRGRATGDAPGNDSVHVQFDGTVSAAGSPNYRIGTSGSTRVILEDCQGCGLAGWGWQDNGVPRDVLGPLIYFAQSGPQRLRIQARDDGLGFDQVVLSAALYRWRAPGALTLDRTILPSSTTGLLPPGPSANVLPGVTISSPANGATFTAPAGIDVSAQASDPDGGIARVEFYAGATRIGLTSGPPYSVKWSNVPAGRYTLTAVAVDNEGAARTSTGVTIDVLGAGASTSTPALPAGWSSRDIGAVSPAGSATASGGTFTLAGAGADIWGSADAFHFAYQTLTGDGSITARVATLEAVDAWTKAGVMMRETLAANSKHAMMSVSPVGGLAFQRRIATGGASVHTSGGSGTAPRWVRLVRSGNTFTAFTSTNGTSWTLVERDTIAMGATIYVGLPITSHKNGTLARTTIDQVTLSSGVTAASSLPPGWSSRDIGAVSPAGSATVSGGTFTLAGAGADIWGSADAFHFAYQTLTGDGSITARVATLEAVDAWTKAGVMMRETLAANAKHAMVVVSPSRGVAFQRRAATGGSSAHTSGGSGAAPHWVRLVRAGNTFSAYTSSNGTSWTLVGRDTIAMGATIYVGLPITSHKNGTLARTTADHVQVTTAATGTGALPVGWSSRDIGAVSPGGSATTSGGRFTLAGAGADIWGSADAFRFAYQTLTGDGSITARVATLQAVDVWTKAGVMMRESLAANAKHAMVVVSPSRGVAFQRRAATGGASAHTSGGSGTAPHWVRLVRSGHTFSAFTSSNGTNWTLIERVTISMGATIYVGLPVTSHRNGTLATTTIESVHVTRP